MRTVEIKKGEEMIKMPLDGIYVNGFIIKSTMCQKLESTIQCDYTAKKETKNGDP